MSNLPDQMFALGPFGLTEYGAAATVGIRADEEMALTAFAFARPLRRSQSWRDRTYVASSLDMRTTLGTACQVRFIIGKAERILMPNIFTPSATISAEFFEHLVTSHALGHQGFHGRDHWLRVLLNGRLLAAETGANLRVVELFALIHDSCRENENDDPLHGWRAAQYACELRGTWFEASDAEMDLLAYACELHSDGHTEADITVQTCWDADRLDLGRVGIRPSARYLCTEVAKRYEVIEAAYGRSETHRQAGSALLGSQTL